MLASVTVTVDPSDTAGNCVRGSETVAGVDPGDHAVVTSIIGSLSPDFVAIGDVDEDEVGVSVCNVGGDAIGETDYKVLVIDG
jgi:hypothetical protein